MNRRGFLTTTAEAAAAAVWATLAQAEQPDTEQGDRVERIQSMAESITAERKQAGRLLKAAIGRDHYVLCVCEEYSDDYMHNCRMIKLPFPDECLDELRKLLVNAADVLNKNADGLEAQLFSELPR